MQKYTYHGASFLYHGQFFTNFMELFGEHWKSYMAENKDATVKLSIKNSTSNFSAIQCTVKITQYMVKMAHMILFLVLPCNGKF